MIRYLLPFGLGGIVVELSEAKKQVEAMQQEVARFGRSL